MLRITSCSQGEQVLLKLEGRLEAPLVDELEKSWRAAAGAECRAVVVDLNAVSFIDSAGRDLLRRMHQSGARLEASLPMTQAVVEEITQ